MAPAGRGGLRPYQPSKFQPFLILCLFVTVIVVGYNFWNLMKKNSVLLVEIAKIQTAIRRLESERKDCSVQLASVDEKRKQHEAADGEKEIALEDTRRVVEDLKAERDLLKLNISKLLSQITSTELKEDTLHSECIQKRDELRMEMQDTCAREKETIQKETNDQLDVMKNQLKLQYQETQKLDQILEQKKQEPVNENSKDTVRLVDGFTGQPENQQTLSTDETESLQQPQQQQQQRQLQRSQRYQKSDSGHRLDHGKPSNSRLRLKDQGNLAIHSRRSKYRNSQSARGVRDNRHPEQTGNDQVFRLKQMGAGDIPGGDFSNKTEKVLGNSDQLRLNQASENGEPALNALQESIARERARLVPGTGEPAPESKNPDSDQNTEVADGKRQKLALESEKSNILSQRSEGHAQDNVNPEIKENNYLNRQRSEETEDAGRNLAAKNDEKNLPEETQT